MNAKSKWLFLGLLMLGIVLRVVAGTQSLGFVHPDEHQQYLEAANKITYGYGVTFWEYERGIRHYLYPGIIAGTLWLLDHLNVTSPVSQAQVIRTMLGLSMLVSLAWYAFLLLHNGKRFAAYSLLAMACFSPYCLFVGARTLSETATIPLLVLMLICLDRRTFLAGILGGLMFGVRFQSALFVAPLFFALLGSALSTENRRDAIRRTCVPYALGCIVSLLFVGFIDYCTWGSWFHSPIEYFRANVIEHIAASFGTSPWYQYLIWIGDTLIDSTPVIAPLALIGAWYKPKYAFALVTFAVAHSCIGHKEPRFLWPMIPVVLILIAEGTESVSRRFAEHKPSISFALVVVFLIAIRLQWQTTDWHMGRSESTALALAKVRELDQVRGVALVGGDAHSGNYFYLRKDIPYVVQRDWRKIEANPQWKSGEINYLIAAERPDSDRVESKPILTVAELSVFRVLPLEADTAMSEFSRAR